MIFDPIPGASWVFVCPRCKQHTRVFLIMPRLAPTAECVACNIPMFKVGEHPAPDNAPLAQRQSTG